MSTPAPPPQNNASHAKGRDTVVLGVMLIAIGLIVSLAQIVELPDKIGARAHAGRSARPRAGAGLTAGWRDWKADCNKIEGAGVK